MLCPRHTREGRPAAAAIGFCGECIVTDEGCASAAADAHRRGRLAEGLVPIVPHDGNDVCPDCGNHCRLHDGELGFCGLRRAVGGHIKRVYGRRAIVSWYYDPLPTNCVADWVCPQMLQTGTRTGIVGRPVYNLAVFYGSCNSDCLFCQNATFRAMTRSGRPLMTPEELAACASPRTVCVCYFGGDPACNPEHSIATSEALVKQQAVRVCYETNGNLSRKWLGRITDVVRDSGGTIKVDLKALTPQLYTALTGIGNRTVINNFRHLAAIGRKREGEFLVASILLVPGYVGTKEVRRICDFIASCDPTIPTALLGFSPHHMMSDLPRTSRAHALAAREEALGAGLTNVRIGNAPFLSGEQYYFE